MDGQRMTTVPDKIDTWHRACARKNLLKHQHLEAALNRFRAGAARRFEFLNVASADYESNHPLAHIKPAQAAITLGSIQ
jgi:hypothetical protein